MFVRLSMLMTAELIWLKNKMLLEFFTYITAMTVMPILFAAAGMNMGVAIILSAFILLLFYHS